MAVNWKWKHKLGEIIYLDENHNQKWKLEMFGGNMLCAFIYRYKQLDKETGKKEKYYTFFNFFYDLKNAKKMMKNIRLEDFVVGNHKVKKVRLCVSSKEYKYSNREMLALGKLFAEMGYKVELY